MLNRVYLGFTNRANRTIEICDTFFMSFLKKIKASAMQFAILVSVIIAVLLGSFLVLSHTHRFFKIQSKLYLKTIDASNSGIEYGLKSKNVFTDSVLVISDNNIETTIKRSFWGGFQVIESTSKSKTAKFSKQALVGSPISHPNIALYISEDNSPLILVGDTKIKGTGYLSTRGVKPGIISGHYYTGDKLIDGQIKRSLDRLPKLNSRWVTYINNLKDFIPTSGDIVINQTEQNSNSFFNNSHIIYQRGSIRLDEIYTGNIIIKSETSITISKYASLTDVIVIAPKIIIETGFKGSASFIASQTIEVKQNVELTYPSALIVTQKQNKLNAKKELAISISDNASVSGIVVYLIKESKVESLKNQTNINIDIQSLSIINGQVYCQGSTELSGTVIGSIYTDRFIYNGFGSLYINHIYSGTILANDLHPKFSGLPFSNTNNGIIRWLY